MSTLEGCGVTSARHNKSKSTLHGLTKAKTYPPDSGNQAYAMAHTARCKLHMAANSPDRNLRFVLGHAFTLDNVLLRIVEIENENAKENYAKPNTKDRDDNKDGQTGSLVGRRVSFSDNNARPSNNTAVTTNNGSPKLRSKSPPPPLSKTLKDDESSSDDYDDDERDPLDDLPDYDDDNGQSGGMGLQRFESASAAPPRQRSRSPSPSADTRKLQEAPIPPKHEVPEHQPSGSSSSDEEEDDEEELDEVPDPKTPPELPDGIDITQVLSGEEDTELSQMYESIRGCPCHGKHEADGAKSHGIWECKGYNEKVGKDGKRYAVMKVQS